MLLELHQSEAGARRVAPLVASVDARPLPGLLAALAGQDAEANRDGVPLIGDVLRVELIDCAAGELISDVLVEARFDDENRAGTFPGHGVRSRPRCPASFRP